MHANYIDSRGSLELPPVLSCLTKEPLGVNPTLSQLTTLGVGGPIADFLETSDEAELITAITQADSGAKPVLVIGGGSNILADDSPFPGLVVRYRGSEMKVISTSDTSVRLRVNAGVWWDEFVAGAVANQWSGAEALSGIPGTIGAAPIQNIGAYGAQVADIITAVRVWDRQRSCIRIFTADQIEFGYRTSIIKRSFGETRTDLVPAQAQTWGPTGRYLVLSCEFTLQRSDLCAPVRYQQLAQHLDVAVGEQVPLGQLRQAVLQLRRSKAMVLDHSDINTHSAGSFFTNPILTPEQACSLPPQAPRFSVFDDGTAASGLPQENSLRPDNISIAANQDGVCDIAVIKTSAAWLIENAGFGRGFALPSGNKPARASLSARHVLAVTNRGGATSAEILELARAVRAGVYQHFGVTLVPEPVLLGCQL